MPFAIRPYRRLLLTNCSALISLIALLFLSIVSAYADWEMRLGSDETEEKIYVDPDTIRRKGNLVKMWILEDYRTLQTVGGASFLSHRAQCQFDCAEESIRELSSSYHSGHMATGTIIWTNSDEGKWKPVAPRTIGYYLWGLACRKE